MPPFREILVGVDPSSVDRLENSEDISPMRAAVEQGLSLARESSARVTFFGSLDLSERMVELLERSQAIDAVRDQADRALAELVEKANAAGVDARAKLVTGRAWLEIVQEVQRNGHDLVIVGTRDLGTVGRIFLGSTSAKLVRHCPSAVWIARPTPPPEEWNILVASDIGEMGRRAMDLVVGLGQTFDVKVHLLHAVEHEFEQWMRSTGLGGERAAVLRQEHRDEMENALHAQLSESDYRTLSAGVQVHIEEGPADLVIRQSVERYGIELLVMGTVARGGIPGFFIGNTAERVLFDLPCSVLILKPADFQSHVSVE